MKKEKEESAEGAEVAKVAKVDTGVRLQEITSRIAEIQLEMSANPSPEDSAMYLNEFKELMAEAALLSKGTKKAKSSGTGVKRDSKLGALKNAVVKFMPRNTIIELEGELTGVVMDKRNGFFIATVTHATGLKFTKKIDQLTVVNPTPEQQEIFAGLVEAQEIESAKAKEAKNLEGTDVDADFDAEDGYANDF